MPRYESVNGTVVEFDSTNPKDVSVTIDRERSHIRPAKFGDVIPAAKMPNEFVASCPDFTDVGQG